MLLSAAAPPNELPHLTGAAILVSRGLALRCSGPGR